MTTQTAGIFTLDDNSAGKRDRVALIHELRELLTATVPGEDGFDHLLIEDPLRAGIVNLLREALGIESA